MRLRSSGAVVPDLAAHLRRTFSSASEQWQHSDTHRFGRRVISTAQTEIASGKKTLRYSVVHVERQPDGGQKK
jgi:hypothetical protein